jgi:hypothetical protein
MATPAIQSITVTYPGGASGLLPGQTATVQVAALDSDARTVELSLVVTDQAGHAQTGTTTVIVTDPLTFSASVVSGGGSVVADPSTPGRFFYTA